MVSVFSTLPAFAIAMIVSAIIIFIIAKLP
ncbi:MAG: hypothetical protein A4E33_02913 [Methanoregula sp. PtaB.Bin085]|nr:MAG: hypothetical protein A4E33_02913 [Methanoregula sp. PtaB.Bin085]